MRGSSALALGFRVEVYGWFLDHAREQVIPAEVGSKTFVIVRQSPQQTGPENIVPWRRPVTPERHNLSDRPPRLF